MDEATTPAPDSPPRAADRWRSRKLWGRIAIGLFVAGGFLLFRGQVPVELSIVFEVPPTMYAPGGAKAPRHAVERLDVRVLDADGEVVGTANVAVGRLEGPLAPAMPLRIPEGDYRVLVTAQVMGRSYPLHGAFHAEDDGPVRVELKSRR
ncbi:MAG: hypothetical protein EP329_05335 [Deltaproteobacteria bacterium]|nr:MAG: hypothetical protein EP329_05335 [Deltaproteobacteria bacterium]